MSERFVISVNKGEVSVLDVIENADENENLLVFNIDFEDNEESASYFAEELKDLVDVLNEQDRLLKDYNTGR